MPEVVVAHKVEKEDVMAALRELGRITAQKMVVASDLTEEETKAVADLFKSWSVGEVITQEMVDAGVFRRYNGELYKCNLPHTTQADWTPEAAANLWTIKSAPGVIPVWSQPTGAQDAWPLGAKVQWPEGGTVWESTIDANTTEPGTLTEHGYWVEVVA